MHQNILKIRGRCVVRYAASCVAEEVESKAPSYAVGVSNDVDFDLGSLRYQAIHRG